MSEGIRLVVGPAGVEAAPPAARAALSRLLSRRLGSEVGVEHAPTYDGLFAQLREGRAHVAWLPPALVVRAVDELGTTPLVSAMRIDGARYHGVLFVPREHPARNVAGVAGLHVAWVDPSSASGCLYPRMALADAGLPRDFFARETFHGSHRAVVSAVRDGRADVGATFAQSAPRREHVLVAAGWDEIGPAAMRPILWSAEIPADALCAARSLDPGVRQRLAELLLCLHLDPDGRAVLRDLFRASGLEPTDLRAYASTRRALAAE